MLFIDREKKLAMSQPQSPNIRLLALAAFCLFRKELRADAAFVLLDAVPVRHRRNRPFRAATRYVQKNWWGWPPQDIR
jgi:hypothetical protein